MTISNKFRARDRAALWHPFTQHALRDAEEFPMNNQNILRHKNG